MSDEFHIPDGYLANMMAQWPTFEDADVESLADNIPSPPVSAAHRWLALCREFQPPGKTIIENWEVMEMISHAALRFEYIGWNGRYYFFSDGSRLISNSDGDRAFPPT